jgi:flagellar export protein FliJ
MTTFTFRLQRVLDFRRTQFQIAESECQRTAAKLHSIQAQQASLASQRFQTRKLFSGLAEVASRDLAPLPAWFKWTETAGRHLANLERVTQQELEKRRQMLVDAQRKVRLLEKLRDDRKGQWQVEFDREIEQLAADSTNSQYARGGGFGRPAA